MRLTVDNRSIKTLNCNENKLENIKIIRLTFLAVSAYTIGRIK